MVDVEVLGTALLPDGPRPAQIRRLCVEVSSHLGVPDGHVAVEFVDAAHIARLNGLHRGKEGATDVLSFPIDGPLPGPPGVPHELGDIVICPEHTSDVTEAIIHGMLHLLGMDHEVDGGEMLALQTEMLARARR